MKIKKVNVVHMDDEFIEKELKVNGLKTVTTFKLNRFLFFLEADIENWVCKNAKAFAANVLGGNKMDKGKDVLKTTLELTLHCDRPVKSAPDYGRIAMAIKNQLQGLIIKLEGGSEVIVEEIRVNQPLAEV